MNKLDEKTGKTNTGGREIHVIDTQLMPTIGIGITILEISLFLIGLPLAVGMLISGGLSAIIPAIVLLIVGTIPGFIFLVQKALARSYLQKLEQRIQSAASEVDSNVMQRVHVLENTAAIVEKSTALDKKIMLGLAKARNGVTEENLEETLISIDASFKMIVENYPTLGSQETLKEAVRQNMALQREITAAMMLYNDAIQKWNEEIFTWISKRVVAAREGFTTRIPYTANKTIKEKTSFF